MKRKPTRQVTLYEVLWNGRSLFQTTSPDCAVGYAGTWNSCSAVNEPRAAVIVKRRVMLPPIERRPRAVLATESRAHTERFFARDRAKGRKRGAA